MSTLGFGIGNHSDENMEMLADRGNGNYYYIDSEEEAHRLFTEELTAMMRVVAWDASGSHRSLERDLGAYSGAGFGAASGDFRFAIVVAE